MFTNATIAVKQCFNNDANLFIPNEFNNFIIPGTIPTGVEIVKFDSDFNGKLEPGVFPPTVIKIMFGKKFNGVFLPGVLPEGLIELDLSGCEQFNMVLSQNVLPTTLEIIKFNNCYARRINKGVLPAGLKEIEHGGCHCTYEEGAIPESVTIFLYGIILSNIISQKHTIKHVTKLYIRNDNHIHIYDLKTHNEIIKILYDIPEIYIWDIESVSMTETIVKSLSNNKKIYAVSSLFITNTEYPNFVINEIEKNKYGSFQGLIKKRFNEKDILAIYESNIIELNKEIITQKRNLENAENEINRLKKQEEKYSLLMKEFQKIKDFVYSSKENNSEENNSEENNSEKND